MREERERGSDIGYIDVSIKFMCSMFLENDVVAPLSSCYSPQMLFVVVVCCCCLLFVSFLKVFPLGMPQWHLLVFLVQV